MSRSLARNVATSGATVALCVAPVSPVFDWVWRVLSRRVALFSEFVALSVASSFQVWRAGI